MEEYKNKIRNILERHNIVKPENQKVLDEHGLVNEEAVLNDILKLDESNVEEEEEAEKEFSAADLLSDKIKRIFARLDKFSLEEEDSMELVEDQKTDEDISEIKESLQVELVHKSVRI